MLKELTSENTVSSITAGTIPVLFMVKRVGL